MLSSPMTSPRKNWMWIISPILILTVVAVAAYLLGGSPEEEFIYPL